MLWVEQPVGTGFATGKVTATTEEEISQDFIKFFKNFQGIFGIKNFKIYVTGVMNDLTTAKEPLEG